MKVNLVGIQKVDFTDRDTGELIQGTKLHIYGIEPVNVTGFNGCEVSTVWIALDSPLTACCNGLQVPSVIDLVYNERVNGKRYLCDIKPVKQ